MSTAPIGMHPGAMGSSPNIFGAGGGKASPMNRQSGWTGEVNGQSFERAIQGANLQRTEPLGKVGVGNAIRDFVLEVDAKQKESGEARAAVLSGNSNNLHRTMIASQEASVSFTLMVEMRNKMMEAYQELMRIQV